jgi:SAM-dependent methyltransferase
MKRHILALARSAGLLPQVDRLILVHRRLAARSRNREFARAHPHFATPPDHLAVDACGHVDWTKYRDSGRRHAQVYARLIADNLASHRLNILEWGCGPGRIIRHIQDWLPERDIALTGTDRDSASIQWCARHIPGIAFAVNPFLPPLSFASGTFDAAYNYSVFTHLSEATQKLWALEMLRILKPGGLLICSTHGEFHRNRLATDREAARYRDGEPVVQSGYEEGKKWFLALHPPRYVRDELLAAFTNIRRIEAAPESGLDQDIWIASKPA